jgi:hypothetical protein
VNPMLIVFIAIAGGLVLLTCLALFIRWIGRRTLTRIEGDPELVGAITSAPANMPGGQSSSGTRVGGIGMLAVYRDQIKFLLATPRRTLVIERADVTAATIEPVLKVPGRYRRARQPFLVLRWNDAGTTRAAGFILRDPQTMLAAIERPSTPHQ